jgi:hypothetical protein
MYINRLSQSLKDNINSEYDDWVTADRICEYDLVGKVLDLNLSNFDLYDYTNDKLRLDIDIDSVPYSVPSIYARKKQTSGTESSYIRVDMEFVYSSEYGRWFTSDYRQAPSSYLSPSVTSNTIDMKINDVNVFENGSPRNGWKTIPYAKMVPMNISTEAYDDSKNIVGSTKNWSDISVSPWNYGIGFTEDVNADTLVQSAYGTPMPHAIYSDIRPVSSSPVGQDIPSPTGRTGGNITNPTLANMYSVTNMQNPMMIIPWHHNHRVNWLQEGC